VATDGTPAQARAREGAGFPLLKAGVFAVLDVRFTIRGDENNSGASFVVQAVPAVMLAADVGSKVLVIWINWSRCHSAVPGTPHQHRQGWPIATTSSRAAG